MNINDNGQREWLRSIISDFYWFVVIMTIIVSCTSCSTSKPVVLERTYHDTVHINNLRLDSVYMHDSIYFESIVKGDTIYRTKEITRWRDRVSIKHDTIYTVRENKADISVPVERKLSLWKQFAVPLISIVLMITSTVSLIWLIHRRK
ncbi:hypothetical protein [Prevotella sp.]|uniref:hypothetical protein n=1 Tax=Prevotella sp. TaxID=59823 RepID=UPI003AB65856